MRARGGCRASALVEHRPAPHAIRPRRELTRPPRESRSDFATSRRAASGSADVSGEARAPRGLRSALRPGWRAPASPPARQRTGLHLARAHRGSRRASGSRGLGPALRQVGEAQLRSWRTCGDCASRTPMRDGCGLGFTGAGSVIRSHSSVLSTWWRRFAVGRQRRCQHQHARAPTIAHGFNPVRGRKK